MTVAAGGPLRARLVRTVFVVGLAINALVCVPFLVDPLDWLRWGGTGQAASADAEWLVFLSDGQDAAPRDRFFGRHPELEVVHEGKSLNTLLIRVHGPTAAALAELKAQPFAALVARGNGALCR